MFGPAWFVFAVLAIEGLLLLGGILVVALAACYVTQYSQFALQSCRDRRLRKG